MPGPRGVITVNGNTKCSRRTEEQTAFLAAEVQSGLLKQHYNPAAEPLDTIKRVRITLQLDSAARQELDQQFGLRPSPNEVVAFAPRVHNYTLKIPWMSTEAQDNPGSTVRSDRPRTQIPSLPFLVSGTFLRGPDVKSFRRTEIQRRQATQVCRVTFIRSS